jgi:hypothetical protein
MWLGDDVTAEDSPLALMARYSPRGSSTSNHGNQWYLWIPQPSVSPAETHAKYGYPLLGLNKSRNVFTEFTKQ